MATIPESLPALPGESIGELGPKLREAVAPWRAIAGAVSRQRAADPPGYSGPSIVARKQPSTYLAGMLAEKFATCGRPLLTSAAAACESIGESGGDSPPPSEHRREYMRRYAVAYRAKKKGGAGCPDARPR